MPGGADVRRPRHITLGPRLEGGGLNRQKLAQPLSTVRVSQTGLVRERCPPRAALADLPGFFPQLGSISPGSWVNSDEALLYHDDTDLGLKPINLAN
jgi:hypothetical protein